MLCDLLTVGDMRSLGPERSLEIEAGLVFSVVFVGFFFLF